MKREEFYRGKRGAKYGIWNREKAVWQFDICEDTPFLAEARLHQKIGDDAKKWRFEARRLPDRKIRELNTPVTFTALWWRWAGT